MWKLREETDRTDNCVMSIAGALAAIERFGGTLAYSQGADAADGLNILGVNAVVEMTEAGIRAGEETR